MKCLREKGQGPRIDQYFLRSQSSQSNEIQRQEANHSSQDISTPVIDVRRTCMDTVSDEPNDPCEPGVLQGFTHRLVVMAQHRFMERPHANVKGGLAVAQGVKVYSGTNGKLMAEANLSHVVSSWDGSSYVGGGPGGFGQPKGGRGTEEGGALHSPH
ncbi:UNVERIFIED_CONTAM: hypothetical protein FKN15_071166 [Acipenser sinensis]